MATDRSLVTLLRALQSPTDEEEVFRLLGSASTILALLSNPLNVTLLTSQLLSVPAIWYRSSNPRTIYNVFRVFSTACLRVEKLKKEQSLRGQSQSYKQTSANDWVVAVIKGADERTPRWRHLCALGGLLIGLKSPDGPSVSLSCSVTVEEAIIKAVNASLHDSGIEHVEVNNTLACVLGNVHDLLDQHQKRLFDFGRLLPRLINAIYVSKDCLHSGFFLSTIDADVIQHGASKFGWPLHSPSFFQLQQLSTGPLFSVLGSLSRFVAFAVEEAYPSDCLAKTTTDLAGFTRCLCVQWRQNKLSEIDSAEESTYLAQETVRESLPLLWRVLRSSMFSAIVILKSLLGRTVTDTRLPQDIAPFLAIQTLHILRDLSFISSRTGASSFTQYTFTYHLGIDLVSQYPVQAEAFLRDVGPKILGVASQHPLDRCQDLFFLNAAEHLAIFLTRNVDEELLIEAAKPYLGIEGDVRLIELFEAAHSVVLSVLSAPQNADILSRHLHSYISTLFAVFPQTLSPRQFRYAIKTLVKITSPPAPISQMQPLLPSSILDLVYQRLASASSEVMLPNSGGPITQPNPHHPGSQLVLSEQSTLVLALIDALPFLPLDQLQDWLPVTAQAVQSVSDNIQANVYRDRFWDILSGGEMDVVRSNIGLTWWTASGGREMVMKPESNGHDTPLMSGALVEQGRL